MASSLIFQLQHVQRNLAVESLSPAIHAQRDHDWAVHDERVTRLNHSLTAVTTIAHQVSCQHQVRCPQEVTEVQWMWLVPSDFTSNTEDDDDLA
ncbi:hypothetical protein ACPF8X_45330, partial [Streptomyces sp. G35A]